MQLLVLLLFVAVEHVGHHSLPTKHFLLFRTNNALHAAKRREIEKAFVIGRRVPPKPANPCL